MNHNYYYTLLGRRAGGPGSIPTSNCSDSLQFRYSYINTPTGQTGDWYYGSTDPTPTQAWEGLVFGGIVQAWPSTPTLAPGTLLYLDATLAQEIKAVDGDQFRIDDFLFTYRNGLGIDQITQLNQPSPIQIRLSGPDANSCNLNGPYTQVAWVNRTYWQQVDRIWLDSALTQPFVGGGNWFHADDITIFTAGTTLKLNNCGWVEGFFAC